MHGVKVLKEDFLWSAGH